MQFPHCDPRILHDTGECLYCDEHAEWQAVRKGWGINFTGHHDADKLPCPSETQRDINTIYKWPGNTPKPSYEPTPEDKAAVEALLSYVPKGKL